MKLVNQTSIELFCKVNDDRNFIIEPSSEIFVITDSKENYISVQHGYESSRKKLFGWSNVYNIVIDNKLLIEETSSETTVIITGEIVHFNLYYAYDRFFITTNGCTISKEELIITNIEHLQQIAYYNKNSDSTFDRVGLYIFSRNFWRMVGLFVLFKLIFWANSWSFSWWWLPLFCILGYGLQILGEKLSHKHMRKKQVGLSELNKYLSVEYITEYYNDSNRKWVANDIKSL